MRHLTSPMHKLPSPRWATVLAAASLWAVAAIAQAGINISAPGTVQAASNGIASTTFTFAFDPGTPIAAFDLSVDYDPGLLDYLPLQSTATYNNGPLNPASLFSADDYSSSVTAGNIFAAWSPSTVPDPLPTFSGLAQLSFAFQLKSSASAPVSLTFHYGTIDSGQAALGLVNGQQLAPAVVSTITAAVPEPKTWALLFAGLSVVLLGARRRKVLPNT